MSQKAFTLTEVITVVAVFSMMAALAVPRFVALNSESRQNSLAALAAHTENSARLTNRVWESAGRPPEVVIDGRIIAMKHGYPTDQSIGDIVINNGDYLFSDGYWKHRDSAQQERCAVLYIPPAVPNGQFQVISYNEDC